MASMWKVVSQRISEDISSKTRPQLAFKGQILDIKWNQTGNQIAWKLRHQMAAAFNPQTIKQLPRPY